jgi:hypothetical protein
MKDNKVIQVLSRVGSSGKGARKGESKGKQIWLMYFIYMYENRTMKPVEIVLRSGEGG